MNDLIHSQSIPAASRAAFQQKVRGIAAYLGVNPDWLMQVLWAESKLKPQAGNVQNGRLVAAGILQWTTASGVLNQTIYKLSSLSDIFNLSLLQQLDLVQWYFQPYRGKMRSYYDVYAATFFPAAIGKQDNWVLQTSKLSAATIARQNPSMPAKGNAFITVADFKRYTVRVVDKTLHARVFGAIAAPAVALANGVANTTSAMASSVGQTARENPLQTAFFTGLIAAAGAWVWRKLARE